MYTSSNPLPVDKLKEFSAKVMALSLETFGENSEGESYVQITLVDKTRYREIKYLPIPLMTAKGSCDEEGNTKDSILSLALRNAGINAQMAGEDIGNITDAIDGRLELR